MNVQVTRTPTASPDLSYEMPSAEAKRASRRRRMLTRTLEGWFFATPWIIGLLTFFLGPMLYSIYLSLTSYNIVQSPRFIGLGNYVEMLRDPLIWKSLQVTTIYAIASVPLSLFLGLLLAILLNQKVRGIAFWRTAYYLPAVISGVAVALLWEWLFNGRYGLVNYVLDMLFGIEGPNWLADTRTAMWAFVVIAIWQVGGSMLINLAALQGVPTALYEAAEIDGATASAQVLQRDHSDDLAGHLLQFDHGHHRRDQVFRPLLHHDCGRAEPVHDDLYALSLPHRLRELADGIWVGDGLAALCLFDYSDRDCLPLFEQVGLLRIHAGRQVLSGERYSASHYTPHKHVWHSDNATHACGHCNEGFGS